MYAVEFDSVVKGDSILIPEQYRDAIGNTVKVVVMYADKPAIKPKPLPSSSLARTVM
ncbi:hypothetical protein FACS1894187_17970 [Synergistales bacterium]|nr:hypothetical protein FACS1894187_17970 [Synergistales bacterium]